MWTTAFAPSENGTVTHVNTNPTDGPPFTPNVSAEFDAQTNPDLHKDILANMGKYWIKGSKLYTGVNLLVPINAPGIEASDWKQRLVVLDRLRQDLSLTNADIRVALRYLLMPRPAPPIEEAKGKAVVF